MCAVSIGFGEPDAADLAAHSRWGSLHVVGSISVLLGPLAYLVCRAMSESFASGSQFLALAVLCAVAFELTWLAYGVVALIEKARRHSGK
jgi:hypothetical protein